MERKRGRPKKKCTPKKGRPRKASPLKKRVPKGQKSGRFTVKKRTCKKYEEKDFVRPITEIKLRIKNNEKLKNVMKEVSQKYGGVDYINFRKDLRRRWNNYTSTKFN